MVKKMNSNESSFFESRRTFLKGTAYAAAGAVVAKGVFSEVIATPAMADEFTPLPLNNGTPAHYPPADQWDSFKELDGNDWKRGGTGRNGVESDENEDGIKLNEFM